MKKKHIYYAGAAVLAYLLYRKATAPAVAPGTIAATQLKGALGAYATGNPMLEELGTLGCSGTTGFKGA